VRSGDARVALVERALFDALMDQQHVAVGVCDSDGVLTMTSRGMEEVLGEPFRPTEHATWTRCYHLHDRDGQPLAPGTDPLARALRGEDVTGQVVCVHRPGRSVRWLLCNALQLLDDSSSVIGAAVFGLDVTARVAEQRRLDDLRDRLVETVNHEVRTPLATIAGQLELLEELVPPLPEPARWSLGAIRRATDRLGEVVDTISELADASQTAYPHGGTGRP